MKLKKWLALGLALTMASSAFALVACNETPTPKPKPDGDDELIDDSHLATPGLEFTEAYEGDKFIGYSVGIGTAYEAESIYVPMMWDDEPVVSVGVEADAFLKLMRESNFDTMTEENQINFMRQYAITYADDLMSIHLPSTLKYFGYAAFMLCPSLLEIKIPKNIKEIPDYTFYYDVSLTKVTFESNDKLEYLGAWSFYNTVNLTSVTLPSSVEEIDMYAFAASGDYAQFGMYGLEEIDLGESLESIGEGAFFACGLKSIDIPDSVTEMGEQAFYTCPALKTVRVGKGLRTIPEKAFWSCSSLTTVNLTAVKKIEEQAFAACQALTNINFGDKLEIIEEQAFWACNTLEQIVLPDTIQTVGSAAFQSCSKLDKVWLGSSIWLIEKSAFSVGPGMGEVPPKYVYYNGTRSEWGHVSGEGKLAFVICADEPGYVAP